MDLLAFEDAGALLSRTARAPRRRRWRGASASSRCCSALGRARIRAGEVERGQETCRRAAELARRLGDGERFARPCSAPPMSSRPACTTRRSSRSSKRRSPCCPPATARCAPAAWRSSPPSGSPSRIRRRPSSWRAPRVAMARRVGDAETLRFALSRAPAWRCSSTPTRRSATAINQEVLRLALAAGDKRVALRAHLFLADDFFEAGRLAPAPTRTFARTRRCRASCATTRRAGSDAALGAMAALWDGRFDEAEHLYRESEELALHDETRGASMAASPLGFCRATERYDDLPGLESRLRASFGSMQHDLGSCIGEMLIAQLHGRAGDRTRAAAQLATVRAHPLFARHHAKRRGSPCSSIPAISSVTPRWRRSSTRRSCRAPIASSTRAPGRVLRATLQPPARPARARRSGGSTTPSLTSSARRPQSCAPACARTSRACATSWRAR